MSEFPELSRVHKQMALDYRAVEIAIGRYQNLGHIGRPRIRDSVEPETDTRSVPVGVNVLDGRIVCTEW